MPENISTILVANEADNVAAYEIAHRQLKINFQYFTAGAHVSRVVNYCVHGFAIGTCPSGCQQ